MIIAYPPAEQAAQAYPSTPAGRADHPSVRTREQDPHELVRAI
jgi:hypothetical protein